MHKAISDYADYFTRPAEEIEQELEHFSQLLKKWQPIQNLVSRETLDQIWTRHFADSLQLVKFLQDQDLMFLDVGSGGGFPAIPMAIACKRADRSFVLIEPTSRKVSFLRTVARETGINVRVFAARSDDVDSRETPVPNVITSRALSALPQLLGWIFPFFGPETRALLHKGREHVEEIEQSRASWDYDVLIHPSDTDATGVILEIANLREKSKR